MENLNTKICQLYDQYNIVGKNCTITVYHINDNKQQFSSFERFKLFDMSSLSPCENIQIEYSFLVVLPNLPKAQNYKITLSLSSRTALRKREISEHGPARGILRYMGMFTTGEIEIQYVDYVVARTFLVAIDEWYNALDKSPKPKLIAFLKDNSEHLPFLFAIVTSTALAISILKNQTDFIGETPTLSSLFSGFTLGIFACFACVAISLKMGRLCEYTVDSYSPISYLKLNRGDDQAIDEFNTSNKKRLAVALSSIAIAVAANILAAYITKIFGF